MLVFSTRLPLKRSVTQEDCIRLFMDWVINSPHYHMGDLEYDVTSREDFECTRGSVTFSIRHYRDEKAELSACRLENREEKAVWYNDCIFLREGEDPSLLIQLDCSRTDFDADLPRVKKPYIVRQCVEKGLCRDDGGIPVTGAPLMPEEEALYPICTAVMRGEYAYSMPVVYVSCDYWGHTDVNPLYLAQQLSGMAHVFAEQSYDTALRLKEDTGGNNAYRGWVGIYFPGTGLCQRYGLTYYPDKDAMTREIIDAVWDALANRLDASVYSWNQIIALQARQKMRQWQDISAQDKEQLNLFMDTFDQENAGLRAKIDELNKQVYALGNQVSSLREQLAARPEEDSFYRPGEEKELYPGERCDLLRSILSQVVEKYPENSRAEALIRSMLAANPRVGGCSKLIDTIREVFRNGEKLSNVDRKRLEGLGFTITEEGSHNKLVFLDPRYTFTASKTPSDRRGGNNLISVLCGTLDVERKI